MTTKSTDIVLNCTSNLNHDGSQLSSHKLNLCDLCPEELADWGAEHSTDLSYRVELARRIALTYDDADKAILFDDIAVIIPEWQGSGSLGICGLDRALLSVLWLSTGFRHGGCVLVYSPPNPNEMEHFLKLKTQIEEHLHRSISIQIFYEDLSDQLHDLIAVFENDTEKYSTLCKEFARQFSHEFLPEYHVRMLKRHFEAITNGIKRSFVFPFEMTKLHQRELQPYSDRLIMSDIPSNDKAKHNFFLQTEGFDDLPKLLAVSPNGALIDNYKQYIEILERLDPANTENNPHNIEVFARTIIRAIDHLYQQYKMAAFVKLDASGTSGWSNVSPTVHFIIYDFKEDQEKRVTYLCDYIQTKLIGKRLPSIAVVEEFVEPQKRCGGIDADYTVCGFVLDGIFYPTSISLGETTNGQYIALWNSSSPADLFDEPADWQRMFATYSRMVALEASEFGYKNGIYAGDLFVTKEGHYKQHDWNIRRGARSSPESLIIFGVSTYETKVTLLMSDFGLHGKMNNVDLFCVYSEICKRLSHEYGMYVFSTGFGYFGKNDEQGDFLKFNILVNPKSLVNTDGNGQKHILPRNEHQTKVKEIIRQMTNEVLQKK